MTFSYYSHTLKMLQTSLDSLSLSLSPNTSWKFCTDSVNRNSKQNCLSQFLLFIFYSLLLFCLSFSSYFFFPSLSLSSFYTIVFSFYVFFVPLLFTVSLLLKINCFSNRYQVTRKKGHFEFYKF